VQPAEVISVSVRPHGATNATGWKTTVNGHPDFIATYDSVGGEPDKQWITIDTNPASPHYNRIYAMWVVFHGPFTPTPFVSYADARADGTHTAWSAPIPLPTPPHTPQGATYLLPHVDPGGVVYTTITNEDPAHQSFATTISVDRSTDGGKTWSVVSTPVNNAALPPLIYPNTTFRDGITDTFTVGNHLDAQGRYPLYIAYEDHSAGIGNVLLTASYDGGATWTTPIQVNDNASPVDEFQPNLAGRGRRYGQRQLLRPPPRLPGRRHRRGRGGRNRARPCGPEPGLHRAGAAVRGVQLLRQRQHPVLRADAGAARPQRAADTAHVGPAAERTAYR